MVQEVPLRRPKFSAVRECPLWCRFANACSSLETLAMKSRRHKDRPLLPTGTERTLKLASPARSVMFGIHAHGAPQKMCGSADTKCNKEWSGRGQSAESTSNRSSHGSLKLCQKVGLERYRLYHAFDQLRCPVGNRIGRISISLRFSARFSNGNDCATLEARCTSFGSVNSYTVQESGRWARKLSSTIGSFANHRGSIMTAFPEGMRKAGSVSLHDAVATEDGFCIRSFDI